VGRFLKYTALGALIPWPLDKNPKTC
jgi:hypothetical protein